MVNQFEVHLVSLDPTTGREIKKTRPCVIISPDEMNHVLSTVIIAPMTSTVRKYPTRVLSEFQDKKGSIVLDQIRTVDKKRLVKKLGIIDYNSANKTLAILQEMFS
ncbi:endoribonuclease MazF [Kordia sp. SMS9]|uniref:type II toxin-antitoxin system PemK/MazF family toxin n=1 Tax=Kordia sp. SMS9 TaxID=2282170 RepID=UPI000E104133|nr:type II toxin-antitoxin system PemK/MazF family toxin [Kordia sp. SMS9]AXG69610.1 endoribonuclease MazF [Kordia sp. SMS9]